jgi:hypothetical protein
VSEAFAILGTWTLRISGMESSDLHPPEATLIRVSLQGGEDGRAVHTCAVAKLLGVAAREIGVVVCLQSRTWDLRAIRPFREVSVLFVQSRYGI